MNRFIVHTGQLQKTALIQYAQQVGQEKSFG